MPTELRHLIFSPAEVLDAVKEFNRRRGTPLPAAGVAQCGPDGMEAEEGTIRFRIVLTSPPAKEAVPDKSVKDTQREMIIESHVLAAALILYCRDRRIPLPVIAEKSLQRFGEQVCLVATIRSKTDRLPPLKLVKV